jgi:glycosyl transferase, family 25
MAPLTAVKVISLEDSEQRRAEFTWQAMGVDVEWSFFPAHKSIVPPLEYSEKAANRRFGRALSPAEIGCYTSHFKCWEWLVHSEYDQAIIFEDDVMIDWKVIKVLSECDLSGYGIKFLRLFVTHTVNWKVVMFRFLSPHYHLIRTSGVCFGTQGYVLNKEAARLLVSNYAQVTFPADWVLTRYWDHKLINYALFPFPVIERHFPSTIGDQRNDAKKTPACHQVFWYVGRIRDRVKRELFDRTVERWPLGCTSDQGPAFIHKINNFGSKRSEQI